MVLKFMGKKRGMTQLFDEKGNVVVCTVIEAEPNVVTQIKTDETDGYTALQTGFEKIVVNDPRTLRQRKSLALLGHFEKSKVEPRRYLTESRLEKVDGYTLGQELTVAEFADIAYVDVCAMSKGKGYQGVMKLHNFAGGPASHGSSFHRHAGSTGNRTTPGRSFPNSPRASHMGYDRVTVQNLKVVSINAEDNLIVVAGAVPGPRNGLVYISSAVKKSHKKK